MSKFTALAAAVAALSFSTPVSAASIDPLELLSSFNVIALGDLTANVHSEGTVYVGGNLTLPGGYDVNADQLSNGQVGTVSGALVVGGDVSGGNINFVNGDVVIGGVLNTRINRADSITIGAAIPTAEVAEEFRALSSSLSQLADTDGSSLNLDQNNLNILSGTGDDGIAIVSAPAGFLSSGGSNNNFSGISSDLTTIVNIAGLNPTLGANIESSLFDNVLLNFFEAETLNINAGVSFSILAPLAQVNVGGGGVNGTVVGGSIFQNAEIRPFEDERLFSGTLPTDVSPVPLPANVGFLLTAFGALAFFGRRRKMA